MWRLIMHEYSNVCFLFWKKLVRKIAPCKVIKDYEMICSHLFNLQHLVSHSICKCQELDLVGLNLLIMSKGALSWNF